MKGEVILKHVSFSLKSLNDTCLIFFLVPAFKTTAADFID